SNYIQVVLGPGKVRDVMDVYVEYGIREKQAGIEERDGNAKITENWQENKQDIKSRQKDSKWKQGVRVIADIFTPMIPAFIASGICNGLGQLLKILMENGTIPSNTVTELILNLIVLIGGGFLTYLVVFTGVNAARQFRVNEMLGGMIGVAALDETVNTIAKLIGWYNNDVPEDSILSSGAGGVIGVIAGVWLLAKVEKGVRSKMPYALDTSFTPLLSMLITVPIFVLVIMPVTGYLSVLIANFLGLFVGSTNPVVRVITGYVLAAV